MERKPLSQSIAQREAYRRATELIGPGRERIGGRMPAGAVDGWTAEPQAMG